MDAAVEHAFGASLPLAKFLEPSQKPHNLALFFGTSLLVVTIKDTRQLLSVCEFP
jgi:hypothetical protein